MAESFVLEYTLNISRVEGICIYQAARDCFRYENDFIPEGWILLLL